MALIIALRNITGYDAEISDYTYEVFINERCIDAGTVIGHTRDDGWEALLQRLLTQKATAVRSQPGKVKR